MENRSIRPCQDLAALLKGEKKPFAVIVGCSDSRVPHEILFDQGVGDLFIVRTGRAGDGCHFVRQHRVCDRGTMGHQNCGAIDVALKRPDVPGHIVALVNGIKHAVAEGKDRSGDPLDNAIRQNVLDQVEELRDLDPISIRTARC